MLNKYPMCGYGLWCQHAATYTILLSACAALAVIVVLYANGGLDTDACDEKLAQQTSLQVCLTPDCVEVGALYLANMDLEADPCEDFFKFTCGKFISSNQLVGNELIRDLGLNSLSACTNAKLIKLIEKEEYKLYNQTSSAVQKLKNLYAACQNTSANEVNDATRIQEYIYSLGGWSLTGNNTNRRIHLERTAFRVHATTQGGLFKLLPVPNPYSEIRFQLQFQPSLATLPTAGLYRPRARSSARRRLSAYICDVITLLGGKTNATSTWRRVEEIIDIERTILELTPPDSSLDTPDQTHRNMTLGQLQELIGTKFQVVFYVSMLLDKDVTEDYVVLVTSTDYIRGLQDVFNNYTDSAISDYLVWTWLHSYMLYMSRPFVAAYEKLSRSNFSLDSDLCLALMKKYFNQVLGALYVETYYDSQVNTQLSDMMGRVRSAFGENLQDVDWMEEVSKKQAKHKVDSMGQVVGYLGMHTNTTLLDQHYAHTGIITGSSLLEIILSLNQAIYRHGLRALGTKVDITASVAETQAPYDTGASYCNLKNTILIWAGLMQFAFFELRQPTAAMFGSLGSVIGHEVAHAFDNNGKNYDAEGAYSSELWDNVTLKRFTERTQCYVQQYSNYTVSTNTHINGTLTLSENIADNTGVKIAYAAYTSWVKKQAGQRQEARLPGLNLTNEQLFYVAMAMPLCTVEADILSRYNTKSDVHSQARYRVIGSLSNFEHFSEDFNCPLGSPMNPHNKCSLW